MYQVQVYSLTSPQGKKYFGSTSIELEKRWQNGKGYKHNDELYADILRYKWENFVKEVHLVTGDGGEATAMEQALIQTQHLDDPRKLYNVMRKTGQGKKLYKRTLTTRAKMSIARTDDLTGRYFDKLFVVKFAEVRKKHAYWLCQCECGRIKIIMGNSLRSGNTTGCGKCRKAPCIRTGRINMRHIPK